MNSFATLTADLIGSDFADELALAAEALTRLGIVPHQASRYVETITESPSTHAPVIALKQQLQDDGNTLTGDAVERVLLLSAACELVPKLQQLPVHPSVKKLLRQEIEGWTKPRGAGRKLLETGTYPFTAASRMATGHRFPAGPMDWEFSGLPRSWIFKIRPADMPRTVWLTLQAGGFRPYFFMHVAGHPKNRGLLLEKEVLRSYYRMARSLQLQPEMKGVLAAAWFFDPLAVKDNPHLEFVQRPFVESGLISTMEEAPPDSGFAEHNPERLKKWESGELRYRIAMALWPRRAAIAWADAHPDLETPA